MLHKPPLETPFIDVKTGYVTSPWAEWLFINYRDKANRVEDGIENNIVILDENGQLKDGSSSLSNITDLIGAPFANLASTKILAFDSNNNLLQTIDLGDWIKQNVNITVTDGGDGTVTLDLLIKADKGIKSDANGIYIALKSGFGLDVDSDGLKLKQQSNIADASAISSISAGAGADTIDLSAFNTDLGTMVTEINGIKTIVNSILALLLASEVMASP